MYDYYIMPIMFNIIYMHYIKLSDIDDKCSSVNEHLSLIWRIIFTTYIYFFIFSDTGFGPS